MNGLHFDRFVRNLPLGSSRRRLLAWALVGVAGPATITHFGLHDVDARKGGKKKKITLCRAGQSVTVSRKARKKLLRKGATVGACEGASPSPPPTQICIPDCNDKLCGDDGCGGECGECDTGEVCKSGQCRVVCDVDEVVCLNECILESCQSQCNEPCRVIGASCCGSLICQRADTGTVACRP
jgi:hypothetical protein